VIRLRHGNRRFQSADRRKGLGVARNRSVVRRLGHEIFGQQLTRAVECALGFRQFGHPLLKVGSCHRDLRRRLVHRSRHVLVLQTGQDFVLLHPAAFAHPEPLQAPGGFRRNGCLALRDDVACRVEQRVRLRGIGGRDRGGFHR
jgi:hypothetical protein